MFSSWPCPRQARAAGAEEDGIAAYTEPSAAAAAAAAAADVPEHDSAEAFASEDTGANSNNASSNSNTRPHSSSTASDTDSTNRREAAILALARAMHHRSQPGLVRAITEARWNDVAAATIQPATTLPRALRLDEIAEE